MDNNTQKNVNTDTDTYYSNKSFWVPSPLVIAWSMFLYIELPDIVKHKSLKKKIGGKVVAKRLLGICREKLIIEKDITLLVHQGQCTFH